MKHQQPVEDPATEAVATLIATALADEDFVATIQEAIITTIRQAYLGAVSDIVKENISGSEHYREIEAETREQLRRWPALKTDQEMQTRVAKTILNSFQVAR